METRQSEMPKGLSDEVLADIFGEEASPMERRMYTDIIFPTWVSCLQTACEKNGCDENATKSHLEKLDAVKALIQDGKYDAAIEQSAKDCPELSDQIRSFVLALQHK